MTPTQTSTNTPTPTPTNTVTPSASAQVPWEPDSTLSPVAWIDAGDTGSYSTSGSVLSSVTDKAGTYTMLIGGTPTVVSGALNSLNVFDFDGSGEYLQSSTYSSQTDGSGNHWVVGVFLADFVDTDKDSFWSYETNGWLGCTLISIILHLWISRSFKHTDSRNNKKIWRNIPYTGCNFNTIRFIF